MTKQQRMYCPKCETHVMATADKPNHLIHGIATVITGGTWGLVWGGVTLYKRRNPWYCPVCAGETK